MSLIFLAFEAADRDFAEVLMRRLENENLAVLDGHNFSTPENYIKIDQAIKNASALILLMTPTALVMTPTALASDLITYQWIYALGTGTPIILVLLKKTSMHPRLAALSYLDFTDHATRPWDTLIKAVYEAVTVCDPHRVYTPHGTPAYIREAILALDSANSDDREGAVENLAQTDHPSAIEALRGALNHPLEDVRILAAIARGEVGDKDALPGLLNALQCEEDKIRKRAIAALGIIGDPSTAPDLIKIVRHHGGYGRHMAMNVFQKMGEAVIPLLENVLQDQNVEMRSWATQTLQGFGNAAVPSLIQAFHDKERAVKVYALNGLANIGSAAAVSALIEILELERQRLSLLSTQKIGTNAVISYRSSI